MLWVNQQETWFQINGDEVIYPWGKEENGGFLACFYGGYRYIIADKAAEITGVWKTTSTDTPDTNSIVDGRANTDAMIIAGISDHPAAENAVNYRGGDFSDWFLPSQEEWLAIHANLSFYNPSAPAAFKSGGAQKFENMSYWTSTQATAVNATYISNTGKIGGWLKTRTDFRSRPVRKVLL